MNKKILLIDEKIYYVYIFLNPDIKGNFNYENEFIFDIEPFYVGKGCGNRIIRSQSLKETSLKGYIINQIHENNMSIKSIKLKENLSEEEAYEYEKYVITKIGRRKPKKYKGKLIGKKGPLVNLQDGTKMNNEIYNHQHILQYNLKGYFVNEFSCFSDAEYKTNIAYSNIRKVCLNQRAQAGKYIWRIKKNDQIPLTIDVNFLNKLVHLGNNLRSVLQYDINGKFIKRYNSIKDAETETGCPKSKIVCVCKGVRKHTLGFIWKYENNLLD